MFLKTMFILKSTCQHVTRLVNSWMSMFQSIKYLFWACVIIEYDSFTHKWIIITLKSRLVKLMCKQKMHNMKFIQLTKWIYFKQLSLSTSMQRPNSTYYKKTTTYVYFRVYRCSAHTYYFRHLVASNNNDHNNKYKQLSFNNVTPTQQYKKRNQTN